MTKLQNLFVALVNMDTFQMTLKLSLFTVDFYSYIYVSLRLRVQNRRNFPLNFHTMRKLSELYSVQTEGISHLISTLCVNCLSSIPEYSRLNHLDVYLV